MKKILPLILAVVLVLGFVGCQNDAQSEETEKTSSSSIEKVTPSGTPSKNYDEQTVEEAKEEIENLFFSTQQVLLPEKDTEPDYSALHKALEMFAEQATKYSSDEKSWTAVQNSLKDLTLEHYPNITGVKPKEETKEILLGENTEVDDKEYATLKEYVEKANSSVATVLQTYALPLINIFQDEQEEAIKKHIETLKVLLKEKIELEKPSGVYASNEVGAALTGLNSKYIEKLMDFNLSTGEVKIKDDYFAFYKWKGSDSQSYKVSKTKKAPTTHDYIVDDINIKYNDKSASGISLPYSSSGYTFDFGHSTAKGDYTFSGKIEYKSVISDSITHTTTLTSDSGTFTLKKPYTYTVTLTYTPKNNKEGEDFEKKTATFKIEIMSPVESVWDGDDEDKEYVKDKLTNTATSTLLLMLYDCMEIKGLSFYDKLYDKSFYNTITKDPYNVNNSGNIFCYSELISPYYLRELIKTLDDTVNLVASIQTTKGVLYSSGALTAEMGSSTNTLTISDVITALQKDGLVDRLVAALKGNALSATEMNNKFSSDELIIIAKLMNILAIIDDPSVLITDIDLSKIIDVLDNNPYTLIKDEKLKENVLWIINCIRVPMQYSEDTYGTYLVDEATNKTAFGYHPTYSGNESNIKSTISLFSKDAKITVDANYFDVDKLIDDAISEYKAAIKQYLRAIGFIII